jgi:hypothetical protein
MARVRGNGPEEAQQTESVESAAMRSPEELGAVDWSRLDHAYGPASDIPELIQALYSTDESVGADAAEELSCLLLVEERFYSATAETVPFLAYAVRQVPTQRAGLLQILVELADPGAARHYPLAAGVRAALEQAVPGLLTTLGDPDPAVRRTAVRLAALVGDAIPDAAVDALQAVCAHDPVPEVRADALTALVRIDPEPDRVSAREQAAMASNEPQALRVAAALLSLERTVPPYPDDLVEVLTDDAADDTLAEDLAFPALGTRRGRLTAVLSADPDAGLLAAVHWIAQGDPVGHGSALADQVARTWRDREREVVPTLLTALPHHRDSTSIRALLTDLTRWIPALPAPPAEDLREVLLQYAEHRNPQVGQAAVTALARCGDARALTRSVAPGLLALRSFADDARALPHLRAALHITDPQYTQAHAHAGELLAALSPATAAQLVPEVASLLRIPYVLPAAARLLGNLGPTGTGDPVAVVAQLAGVMAQVKHLPHLAAAAVAHARLTGGLDSRTSLPILQAALSHEVLTDSSLAAVALLGPLGAPLLPLVRNLRAPGRSPAVRLAAAEAHWRITGDPEPELPLIAAAAADLRTAVHALELLLAIDAAPEQPLPLLPALPHYATSPRRLLPVTAPSPRPPEDERLRTAARRLLRRANA